MKKLGFLLIALTALVVFSCKSKSTFTDYSPEAKLDNALLWKIEGKGVKKPSYLFGTIHIIPTEDYFLPAGTEEAINNSDIVFTEIDMKDMKDMSKMMGLMSKIQMPNGETLEGLLSTADYKIVEDHFKSMGMPMVFIGRMKPMFSSMFADLELKNLMTGGGVSYEMEIGKIAKDAGKEFGGLETLEFQLSIFDKIPLEDQAQMLVETIKSSKAGNETFGEMVKVYTSQDLEGLNKMMNESSSMSSESNDVLLVERNENWIPIIVKNIKKQSTFFAVGAGHLPGNKGVIKLLRKAGYKVSPVLPKK